MGLDELEHHALDVSNDQVCASWRADLLFWPCDDGQATENRDFNPLFGDLEPFSDRLTRERLVPLDGGFDVACKDRHARAEHLHSTALSLSNTPSCVRTTVPEG